MRGAQLVRWVLGMSLVALLALPVDGLAMPLLPRDPGVPTVTLTSPANGALITGGQPFFGGTAGTDPGDATTVSIQVFSGTSTIGIPIQVLGAQVSDGNYSTGPNTPLPDGLYTAQASQGSEDGSGVAAAVSFRVDNAAPQLTLNAPAGAYSTGSPTISGTASTAGGASSTATLVVYPGSTTNATPVSYSAGTVGSAGAFSIQISPTLADGAYMVVAVQQVGGNEEFSAPLGIQIKTAPPALTLTSPTRGESVGRNSVSFTGAAGDAYGDDPEVDVTLYKGSSTTGTLLGTQTVTPTAGTWQSGWPSTLALGIYTVEATQADIAGAMVSKTVTFIVVPSVGVIGKGIQISQSGIVTVPIGCDAPSGTCRGVVLIVTTGLFHTTSAGPRGHLRVLFAGFVVPARTEKVIAKQQPASSYRVLRRKGTEAVTVTVVTSANGGAKQIVTASRTAKVGP